jgi:hypothetical protein
MKRLLHLFILGALLTSLPASGFAAEEKPAKKKPATPAPEAAKKPVETPVEAPAKVVGEAKAIPMYVRADSIDAAGKSFTMKKKDGAEVKHVLTATTTIANGEAPAKFEDIKVGEYVSGLRKKKSDTEYEVVKITKFGAAAPKKEKTEGEKKPE